MEWGWIGRGGGLHWDPTLREVSCDVVSTITSLFLFGQDNSLQMERGLVEGVFRFSITFFQPLFLLPFKPSDDLSDNTKMSFEDSGSERFVLGLLVKLDYLFS